MPPVQRRRLDACRAAPALAPGPWPSLTRVLGPCGGALRGSVAAGRGRFGGQARLPRACGGAGAECQSCQSSRAALARGARGVREPAVVVTQHCAALGGPLNRAQAISGFCENPLCRYEDEPWGSQHVEGREGAPQLVLHRRGGQVGLAARRTPIAGEGAEARLHETRRGKKPFLVLRLPGLLLCRGK